MPREVVLSYPLTLKRHLHEKIRKSFEVSGLIVSIQLLSSFRVPVDGDFVQFWVCLGRGLYTESLPLRMCTIDEDINK